MRNTIGWSARVLWLAGVALMLSLLVNPQGASNRPYGSALSVLTVDVAQADDCPHTGCLPHQGCYVQYGESCTWQSGPDGSYCTGDLCW